MSKLIFRKRRAFIRTKRAKQFDKTTLNRPREDKFKRTKTQNLLADGDQENVIHHPASWPDVMHRHFSAHFADPKVGDATCCLARLAAEARADVLDGKVKPMRLDPEKWQHTIAHLPYNKSCGCDSIPYEAVRLLLRESSDAVRDALNAQ